MAYTRAVGSEWTNRAVLVAAMFVGFLVGPPALYADTPRAGLHAAATFDPYFLWAGGHVQTGRAAGFRARAILAVGVGEGLALGGGFDVLWYLPITRRRLTPYTGIESFGLRAWGGESRTSSWYTIGGPGGILGVQHDNGRFVDVRVSFISAAPALRVVYGKTWGDIGRK